MGEEEKIPPREEERGKTCSKVNRIIIESNTSSTDSTSRNPIGS
jgi:hypothetical protein